MDKLNLGAFNGFLGPSEIVHNILLNSIATSDGSGLAGPLKDLDESSKSSRPCSRKC